MKNDVLPLKQKHPQTRDAYPEIMLPDKPEEIHPIKFDSIDAENVRKAALKTRGGAGPSGIIQSLGSRQVCAGQDAGCESLIHAM